MQAGVGLHDTDMMPILHNHCLGYRHNFALFYQWFDIMCSLTILFSFMREASSETYGPRVYFPSYKFPTYYFPFSFRFTILQSFTFRSVNQKYQKYLLYIMFSFIYLYHISILQVTVKGLTTPLSCWVQVVWLFVQVLVICVLSPTGLIPWFSNWGKYLSLLCCITISSSRKKPTQAQEVAITPP